MSTTDGIYNSGVQDRWPPRTGHGCLATKTTGHRDDWPPRHLATETTGHQGNWPPRQLATKAKFRMKSFFLFASESDLPLGAIENVSNVSVIGCQCCDQVAAGRFHGILSESSVDAYRCELPYRILKYQPKSHRSSFP